MLRWALALAMPVCCALAFRVALPEAHRLNESVDFKAIYDPVARQLLAGNGLTTPEGAPALRVPPGHPVFLAAAYAAGSALGLSDPGALDLLVFICIALSSLFLYLIARDVFDGWLALLPSAAWSTYPLALWLTKQPNSEIPFTMLLFGTALVLWYLGRRPEPSVALAAGAGALAGLAMLVRPIALFLPIVLAALAGLLGAEWPRRGRALVAAVILASSAAIIAPWEVHACRASRQLVLLSTTGLPSMLDGLTFGVTADKDPPRRIYVPEAIRTVMLSFDAQRDDLNSLGAIARATARELAQHPLGTVGLMSLKLVRAWYGTDSQRLDRYVLPLQIGYLGMLGWAAYAAWRAGGKRRQIVIFVAIPLAYFWMMSVMALPLARYMVPAIGLTFLIVPILAERPENSRR